AEGEVDARKQSFAADVADHVQVSGGVVLGSATTTPGRWAARSVDAERVAFQIAAGQMFPRLPVRQGASVAGEIKQAQRHRALFVYDDGYRFIPHLLQPRRHVAYVRDRGRQP